MKLRERVVPLCQFQVLAQTKFGTLEPLKRDKSAAKLYMSFCEEPLRLFELAQWRKSISVENAIKRLQRPEAIG